MKRIILALCSLLLLTSFTTPACCDTQDSPEDVPLTAERVKNDHIGDQFPTAPIRIPSASIKGHSFYINSGHPDYVLQLVNPTDETIICYQVIMPSSADSVLIPSEFTGNYIIQLLWNNWKFWGYIYLP